MMSYFVCESLGKVVLCVGKVQKVLGQIKKALYLGTKKVLPKYLCDFLCKYIFIKNILQMY
jgi:hypothetical protein